VAVDVFDRVLDGHDVTCTRPVDVVDHCRLRRRFARAGRAGDQHQTLAPADQLLDGFGHAEVFESGNLQREDAEGAGDGAALEVSVAAHPHPVLESEGEVE